MDYQAHHRFGTISSIRAEAIGEPGDRTFRLLLHAGAAIANLWLEKEQLYQLAVYIQEVCATLSPKNPQEVQESPEEPWPGDATEVEFKVGKLALAHDPATNAFLVLVHNTEAEEGAPADLSFWITLDKAQEVSQDALKVCAAGRPRCFLCGQPINPEGHMCVRSNGHRDLEA